MEGVNWSVVISAVSLEVVLMATACGVVWKLSRSEIAIRAAAEEKIKALSDKLYQVEIWARDEFVRKGSFEIVINRMEKSIEKIADKIDAKFADLTKRIDEKH